MASRLGCVGEFDQPVDGLRNCVRELGVGRLGNGKDRLRIGERICRRESCKLFVALGQGPITPASGRLAFHSGAHGGDEGRGSREGRILHWVLRNDAHDAIGRVDEWTAGASREEGSRAQERSSASEDHEPQPIAMLGVHNRAHNRIWS